MKNRVLGLAAAIAALAGAGIGGITARGKDATPELGAIFSEPRSTMWRGIGQHQRSKRRVAMDKRDARKRRNQLRAKGR
jgi:hypothetical protein